MREPTTTAMTWCVLASIATISFVLPGSLSVPMLHATGVDEMRLPGKIRDFSATHPDFDVAYVGHYAGNVDLSMVQPVPTFKPGGFRVNLQWEDRAANSIAPHLFKEPDPTPTDEVPLVTPPNVSGAEDVDTWDSTDGPYSSGGPAPTFATGSPMPPVRTPPDLGPSVGNVTYGGGTSVVDANIHCTDFTIQSSGLVRISGNVTIVCDDDFTIRESGRLELLPGAELTVYVADGFSVVEAAEMNLNTFDPSRVHVYAMGVTDLRLLSACRVCATVEAPLARMVVDNASEYYGVFVGRTLRVDGASGFHVDVAPRDPLDACGNEIIDTAGTAGSAGSGAITDAATFYQWFIDFPGINMSGRHTIVLERDGGGIWSYLDNSFYPIDGRLFGNEDDSHNNYFTYHVEASFVYRACDGQFLEFEGGDGVWLFIGQDLALDLGGVQSGEVQRIDVDRLDLVDGQTYPVNLFYASRSGSGAVFRLRTSIDLISNSSPLTVSAMFD